MKKTFKMDRFLVSKQMWELNYIVHKIGKEKGNPFAITKTDVLKAVHCVGRSRRKVYKYLRNNF